MNDKRTIVDLANNITLEIELTDEEQAALNAERTDYIQQEAEKEAKVEAAKAEKAALATAAAKDLDQITTLLAAVQDPAVAKLLEIIIARQNLQDKVAGIDHSEAKAKG